MSFTCDGQEKNQEHVGFGHSSQHHATQHHPRACALSSLPPSCGSRTVTMLSSSLVVTMLCVFVSVSDADVAIFSSNSGVTTPVTRTFEPEEKLVQGLIQAGFPRARAEAALRAVGNENCCQPQMKWLFEQSRATNAERPKPKSGQCNKQENTDYDGFAVRWGSANIQQSWEDCCKSCHDYVPNPPDFYPCNIWVFCAHEECFAPAAGEFKRGQCWLKYQEDPTNPHVNMRGKYSDDYRRTHPTPYAAAPEMVAWTAGSVVEEGARVGNGTWSSRSHWKLMMRKMLHER